MSNITAAWHFVGKRLRDGRAIPADGEWLTHDGPIRICESGLHASRNPLDALHYAPGTTLCRVEVRGIEDEQPDKLVARERRIVARVDATDMLRRFAREAALGVIHLWAAPEVVRRYLETGDESIRIAARAAARADAADAAAAAYAAAADAADAARAALRARFAAMVEELFAQQAAPDARHE